MASRNSGVPPTAVYSREVILDGRDRGILNVLRRGEMRLACAEIHDINSLLA